MKQNELIAINDAVFGRDLGPGRNEPGVIVAANEQRFTSAHYQEALTSYIVGWTDKENLQELLDSIAPPVQVGRRFEWKKYDNTKEFLAETGVDDIRQIGGTFKRVEYPQTSATDKTLNKGLTIRIDDDDRGADGWAERAAARIKRRLLRAELIRAISVINAAATNAAVTWTAAGSGSPDGDLRDMTVLGGDAAGIDNNIVIMGRTAWNQRQSCYEAQNTPYAGVAANLDEARLAAKLALDTLITVKPRYQSAAATKSALLGLLVYAYFAESDVGKDDPSSVKRFWSPTQSGGMWRVYQEDRDKYSDITVEHYSNIVAASTVGVRKLTVSTS